MDINSNTLAAAPVISMNTEQPSRGAREAAAGQPESPQRGVGQQARCDQSHALRGEGSANRSRVLGRPYGRFEGHAAEDG